MTPILPPVLRDLQDTIGYSQRALQQASESLTAQEYYDAAHCLRTAARHAVESAQRLERQIAETQRVPA